FVLTVVAWVGAVRRAGVRIGRATHARMALSENYSSPPDTTRIPGMNPSRNLD
ncbi:MAG: hypothetical protein RI986_681, partial [Planctomycetota bacterium]